MEKDVVREICKELNWMEKIIVKVFKKSFIKVYRLGLVKCFNYYNQ
jgi:hypothetical protein